MKVVVYHSEYGCETGCCGHVVKTADGSVDEFTFNHPYLEEPLEWAKDLVRDLLGEDHVKDLDWDNCIISVY